MSIPEDLPEPDIHHGVPAEEMVVFLDWRERVKGTNISEKTLLATDYLNHFNEIVMLIEMVPDMPEMLEDCCQWQPKSYQEHFRDSSFSDRELAIDAYQHVPSKFRKPFEEVIDQLQAVTACTIQKMTEDITSQDFDRLRLDCQASSEIIHKIIQTANSIIHGSARTMEQAEIDLYLNGA